MGTCCIRSECVTPKPLWTTQDSDYKTFLFICTIHDYITHHCLKWTPKKKREQKNTMHRIIVHQRNKTKPYHDKMDPYKSLSCSKYKAYNISHAKSTCHETYKTTKHEGIRKQLLRKRTQNEMQWSSAQTTKKHRTKDALTNNGLWKFNSFAVHRKMLLEEIAKSQGDYIFYKFYALLYWLNIIIGQQCRCNTSRSQWMQAIKQEKVTNYTE